MFCVSKHYVQKGLCQGLRTVQTVSLYNWAVMSRFQPVHTLVSSCKSVSACMHFSFSVSIPAYAYSSRPVEQALPSRNQMSFFTRHTFSSIMVWVTRGIASLKHLTISIVHSFWNLHWNLLQSDTSSISTAMPAKWICMVQPQVSESNQWQLHEWCFPN